MKLVSGSGAAPARSLSEHPRSALRWTVRAAAAVLVAVATAVLAGPAMALPENRAYEMVSPADKNSGDVGMGATRGFFLSSEDGSKIAYNAMGGFGNPLSSGFTGTYAAERGIDTWDSTSLVLPMSPAVLADSPQVNAISPDFSRVISETNLDLETGEPGQGLTPIISYLYEPGTGETDLLTVPDIYGTQTWRPTATATGGNEDFSKVVFGAPVDLLDDGLSSSAGRIYSRTDDGLKLESRLPNGDPTTGYFATIWGGSTQAWRPVSEDADVAYFQLGPNQAGAGQLYRRDLVDEDTVLVNADENPNADPPPGDAHFAGASADGGLAYFTSAQQLVAEDTNAERDLYLYDHSKPAGSRLTLASAAANLAVGEGVSNTYGVSIDGGTIVFAVRRGNTQQFYAYRDGVLIDTGVEYMTNFGVFPVSAREARLSDDGETFAFLTEAPGVTPDDNGGNRQLYVFDVESGDLDCASCRPGGPNSEAAHFFNYVNIGIGFASQYVPGRVVSDEGHVFFQTAERLVPEDTNGKEDVYLWKDGKVDLISSGRSADHSYFADASRDGSTVFFVTREKLSGWDVDNNLDIYAAKIGGGLPEPEAPDPPCQGDDCQEQSVTPPAFTDPGSETTSGHGNPKHEAKDCKPLRSKAARLKQRANRLKTKAKRFSSGSSKSTKKAKRLRRQAKAAQRKAKASNRQLQRCRQGEGS